MKILDAIKRGFDIANNNMKLILIVFIFNVVWNLVVIPFTPEASLDAAGAGVAMSPALTILSLMFVLASIFIQGGVLGSVRDYIKENKLDLGRFKGYGAKFYIRLLCLALIIMLIIAVVAFIATLIIAASAPTKNAIMITLTTIIALIVGGAGIYITILLFLSPYILVVEDVGIVESMSRSIAFVRKVLLKIIGLGALLVLIGFGIGLIMGIIAGIISLAIKGKFLQFITGILNGGVNAYLSILVTGCLVTYYLAGKGAESKENAPAA
jgi:succinate dehydrogenase hydrophobic anchor subunit